jgi:predicted aminopeptidase
MENSGKPLKRVVLTASALALVLMAGCGQLQYAWQAGMGQFDVVQKSRPVSDWLGDPTTPERLRVKLMRSQAIRDFATAELLLPDNGSYRRYADLRRPAVVWNVFAAPPDSLKPHTWCFPVAGCVPYRGYYKQADATAFAANAAKEGLETYVGPVSAYSTLGWFDDPLLNTFINASDVELARLIFHELAHQLIYIPGDAEFNEGFASAVETIGVELWLAKHGDLAQKTLWETSQRQRKAIQALLLAHREKLQKLYAEANLSAQAREKRKAALTAALRADYEKLKITEGFDRRYDGYFAGPLNNAQLASYAVYARWDEAFRRVYVDGEGLVGFYSRVRALAAMQTKERVDKMTAIATGGQLTAPAAPIAASAQVAQ